MSQNSHSGIPARADGISGLLPVYKRLPVRLVRGSGSRVWDDQGKSYIDLVAGIAVNCLGHCPPQLQSVLTEQAGSLWHTSNLYQSLGAEQAAAALIAHTPMEAFFFCNSGAEANEGLLKLARRHGQKNLNGSTALVTMSGSFHGRTTGAAVLTGQERIHSGFGPLLEDVFYLPPNDNEAAMALFKRIRPCGVLVEPILAEGGGIGLNSDYLSLLRRLCDECGALLMFDEVQTGIGRTGSFVCANDLPAGMVDALSLAKGLAGGFPAGAFGVRSQWISVLEAGTHASTFGGNFLATCLIHKVTEIVAKRQFLDEVVGRGRQIEAAGQRWLQEGRILRLFGRGLWWIIDPLGDVAHIEEQARARGVLVLPTQGRSLRLLPALNIEPELLAEGLAVLDEIL